MTKVMVAAAGSAPVLSIGGTLATALWWVYAATVVGFSALWILLNAYQYYPLARAALGRLVDAVRSLGRPEPPTPRTDGGVLPTVDVLLAAYDEADVIEQAIASVLEADYPADHRALHVLIEPDDDATRGALEYLSDRYDFHTHVVPEAYPGKPSKPRALNYGYSVTDADLVGVVDAEDVVDPGLFIEVAETLRLTSADYALGHLDMANENDGWLNLLFRAEYGFWYDLVVPAFARVGFPVPLGGTTCFFRREVLEAVAQQRYAKATPWSIRDWLWFDARDLPAAVPWDQETVTEDFELGLRLWQAGYEFAYLEAVTREESPISLDGWLDQRTRWQTGKLQTFAGYLDDPPAGWRRRAHVTWQSFLPHLGPINLLGVGLVFWLSVVVGVTPTGGLARLLELGLAFFVGSSLLFAAGYWSASDAPVHLRLRRSAVVALSVGFYWLLQWLADARALANVHRGRLEWIPSDHLGRHVDAAAVAAGAYVDRPRLERALEARHVAAALLGTVALATALRGLWIDRWSLWHDEIYTITVRGSAPVAELLTMTTDPHPPLYYLVAHGWMDVVGTTPTAMRWLSIAFSVGTVLAVFLLGRAVYDAETGLLAALLVAVSTTHVHFGRTVRMYSLFTMLAALSWYGYVELRRDGCCFSWLGGPGRLRAVGYLVVTTALVYTHVYGLFVVASQHLVQLLSGDGRAPREVWWPTQAALGLAALPWLAVVASTFFDFAGGTSPIAWIPAPTVGQLRETVLLFAGYPEIYPIAGGSAAAFAVVLAVVAAATVAALFSVLTVGPERAYFLTGGREAAMLALFAAGLFVPFALGYLLFPAFVPRYALAASLPGAVLVARGVLKTPNDQLRGALLGVLLVGAMATTGLYFASDTQADWRGVSDHLAAEADGDDLVVFQPTWIREDVAYYAPDLAAETYALRPDDRLAPDDLDRLRGLAGGHDTVWLLTHTGTDADRALAALETTHRPVATVDAGVVVLYRLEADPG